MFVKDEHSLRDIKKLFISKNTKTKGGWDFCGLFLVGVFYPSFLFCSKLMADLLGIL